MDTLLLGLNARYSHTNLALLYLRNEIRAAGHAARILEFDTTTRRQDILETVALTRPRVILISVYIWNGPLVTALLPDFRMLLPSAVIILGGPEVSYPADEWLERYPEVDVVVVGPAEEAVRRLAENGFGVEYDERILTVPNRPFSEVPFPYLEEDFPGLSHKYVYYESSRGCPCTCAYCVSGRADQAPDYRDVATTTAELERIIEHERLWPDPPIVKFVDRTFNARPARAREIWRFLAHAETRATFHFEIHPAFLTDEDFLVLASAPAGRFQFEIGIQSVHPATLSGIGRRTVWETARTRVARIIELGTIAVHLDLIVGLPGEGLDEIARSIDEVISLKPKRFDVGFLKSLPGTEIRERAEENSQIAMHDAPYQVLANAWLTLAEFSRLRRIEQVIDAVWNTNRLETEIDRLAESCGGYFAAFCAAADHAAEVGYNLSTRQKNKVQAFLQSTMSCILPLYDHEKEQKNDV